MISSSGTVIGNARLQQEAERDGPFGAAEGNSERRARVAETASNLVDRSTATEKNLRIGNVLADIPVYFSSGCNIRWATMPPNRRISRRVRILSMTAIPLSLTVAFPAEYKNEGIGLLQIRQLPMFSGVV